jgi:uncharacterized RDD family membrane protein YckC
MEALDQEIINEGRNSGEEFASIGSRIGASLLDVLIMSPITIGLNFYNVISLKSLPLAIVTLLFGVLYKPFLEYFKGATLGKMIVGIKVTDTAYEKMSLEQSLLRSFPFYLSTLVMLPMTIEMFTSGELSNVTSFMEYGVFAQKFTADYAYTQYVNWVTIVFLIGGIIAAASNKNKMALHDMLAKTYVVKK